MNSEIANRVEFVQRMHANPNVKIPVRKCSLCNSDIGYVSNGQNILFDPACSCPCHDSPPCPVDDAVFKIWIDGVDSDKIESILQSLPNEPTEKKLITIAIKCEASGFSEYPVNVIWSAFDETGLALKNKNGFDLQGTSSSMEWARSDAPGYIAREYPGMQFDINWEL